MDKQKKEIIIIGPSPDKKAAGIVTHIRNLINYSPLADAKIFDIGSLNAAFKENRTSKTNIIFNLIRLRGEVKKKCIIIINTSIYNASLYKLLLILLFLKKNINQKILVFFHGGRIDNRNKYAIKLMNLLYFMLCKVDRIYFLSEDQKIGFDKEFNQFNTFIYNNFSTSNNVIKRSNEKNGKIYKFLFVGRLNQEKGIFEALQAAKQLTKLSSHKFKFLIAGDGVLLTKLKKFVEINELHSYVDFLGFVNSSTLENVYAGSDCLILPAYREGFPYVYIEAMRAGLPVISTKTGALERLIKNGYNGYHIEMKDVDDLVSKMQYFLEERPPLSENCYKEFKENLSKKKAEEFYAQLIAENT